MQRMLSCLQVPCHSKCGGPCSPHTMQSNGLLPLDGRVCLRNEGALCLSLLTSAHLSWQLHAWQGEAEDAIYSRKCLCLYQCCPVRGVSGTGARHSVQPPASSAPAQGALLGHQHFSERFRLGPPSPCPDDTLVHSGAL